MHIKLTCAKCGEQLAATGDIYAKDEIEFQIDPCTSFDCTQHDTITIDSNNGRIEEKDLYPELEPLVMPYSTLMRVLDGKQVTMTYHKMNGEMRELTGKLGRSDGRAIGGNLVYFHELNPTNVLPNATSCKVLAVNRIMSVDHYDEDGSKTIYTVQEAL